MPRSLFDDEPVGGTAQQSPRRRRSLFDDDEQEQGLITRTASAVSAAVPQPVKTTVSKVFDILGRPGAATAGLIGGALSDAEGVEGDAFKRSLANLTGERRDDFDQVLEEQGFEDSFARNAAGFVGDVVVDPLNLVGFGAVQKVVGKGAGAAGKAIASGAAKLPEPIRKAGKAVADDLGEKFVPRYGLEVSEQEAATLGKVGKNVTDPKAVKDEYRRFQKERSTIPARTEHQVIDTYKDIPNAADRIKLSDDIHAGAGSTPALDKKVVEHQQRMDDVFQREVAAKVQKPENYDPDYGAFFDFHKKGTDKDHFGPHSAISAKLGPAKHRKVEDYATAKALGAEQDIAIADYHRLTKSEKAILSSEFAQDMLHKYGIKVEDLQNLNPADIATFRKVEKLPAESPLKALIDDYVLPEKVAKMLDETFTGPKKPGTLGKIYDKAMGWWRAQATILRPGFHSTNIQGNLFNTWLGSGLHPKSQIQSIAWAAGKPPAMIGKYTADEVSEYMHRFGVGGADHNFVTEMAGLGAEKQLVNKLANAQATTGQKVANAVSHPIQSARMVGSTIEDTAKRALFFDALNKGMSMEDAAKHVDKFLFDYADLTAFEKNVMRKVFPFYTWMRKNVPLQAEQLVKQPHKYAAIGKTQHAVEEESKDRGTFVPRAERADYLQSQDAIQVPTGKGKDKKFYTPYLPFQDLNKLPVPGGSNPLTAARETAAGINPVAKALLEVMQNKSLFFNRPLYDSDFDKQGIGILEDRQKINDVLQLLPESVKKQLFTETVGRDGKPQFETPAAVRYALQQIPLMESSGKAAFSISRPEEATNPYNYLSSLAGVRVTNRTKKQETADRKDARSEAKRIRTKKRRQDRKPAKQAQKPVKKERVTSLFERYNQD